MRVSKRIRESKKRVWKVCYEKTLEWLLSIWFGTTKNMATVFEYLKGYHVGERDFFFFWNNYYKEWGLVAGIRKTFQ